MNSMDILLKSLDLIIENKVWEDRKPSDILRILNYVHNKGWLYIPRENNEIIAIICAYRIKEITKDSLIKLPLKEEGDILYVPFVLSLNKKDNIFKIIRNLMKTYLDENPNVNEIILEDKNNKIKSYNLKALQGV